MPFALAPAALSAAAMPRVPQSSPRLLWSFRQQARPSMSDTNRSRLWHDNTTKNKPFIHAGLGRQFVCVIHIMGRSGLQVVKSFPAFRAK
jgi:hypothetical protein